MDTQKNEVKFSGDYICPECGCSVHEPHNLKCRNCESGWLEKMQTTEDALSAELQQAKEENKKLREALKEISTPQTGLNQPMAIQTLIRFVMIAREALK
jgi:hypothetical protein